MSWVTFALGLIRDVAATEQGQEIINDLRSGATGARPQAPSTEDDVDAWRESVENRFDVNTRNVEMLVQMLNAQDENLLRIQKRQRVWNVVLGAGLLIVAASVGWMLLSG